MASNLLIKDGANQDRYIQSEGSGTDAAPVLVHHIVRLRDNNGSALGASSGSPLGTELALITRPIPSGTQTITGSISITGVVDVKQGTASALNFTLPSGTEVRQSNASALKATAEVYQAVASALNVTASKTGDWHVRIGDSLGSALGASSGSPLGTEWALITRPIPSGTQTITGTVSLTAVADVRQATASALNATVLGAVEVRQASTSALKGIMEVFQANGSALKMSGEVQQLAASAFKATAEVYQANASAFQVTAEVRQATASALQITAAQATNASGWTIRVVTPSGDTAMDTSNSAVRVNLVAGGAGNGNIQDGVQSNLTATVKGYASGSPLMVALTDSGGAHIPSLDVKQTTASALQMTATQATNASGWTVRVVTPSGDTAMNTATSTVRVANIGTTEVQQLAASAFKATAEIYQATASALNAQIVGEIAHDGVDSGNPIKVGGKALSTSPTNVAGNDRTNVYYDLAGRLMVRTGGQGQDTWTATCAPLNSNVRATITRVAGAANVRQVCTGFTVTVIGGSAAPTASPVYAWILDGTSGTNYLWNAVLGVQATAGATAGIARQGLWIKSSQASALTLEFNVAANNVVESVSMEGTTITEA